MHRVVIGADCQCEPTLQLAQRQGGNLLGGVLPALIGIGGSRSGQFVVDHLHRRADDPFRSEDSMHTDFHFLIKASRPTAAPEDVQSVQKVALAWQTRSLALESILPPEERLVAPPFQPPLRQCACSAL